MTGQPSADRVTLRAGNLACVLDGADVRDLRVGSRRILTRLYVAARDQQWNTIPFQVLQRTVDGDDERFSVELSCAVDEPPIRAEWVVTIAGGAAGEFSYALRGRALSSFRYAKLGLNLHHPLPESLGVSYLARRRGEPTTGRIPTLIDPQLFIDGKLTGMFTPYDELTLRDSASDAVLFRFEGDEFEMQDHRNWTDYNLKSYSTPLEVPLPLVAEPGQPIFQAVRIDVRGTTAFSEHPGAPRAGARSRLAVDRSAVAVLPRVGSEFPDEVAALDDQAARLVSRLALDYVRVTLDLTTDGGAAAAAGRASAAGTWGYPLELVLVVSPGEVRADEVARLGTWLDDLRPRIEHVAVIEGPRGFIVGRTATPGPKVRAYREVVEARCGPTALVSATEQFFAELNRLWPDLAGVDGVGYTICPQVHAADDISLMENCWGQADTVATARARSGGRPVHVTSLVMIGKFGPYPGGIPEVPVLSAYGDPRQHENFGAAWTVGSLRQLVDAAAASATYFELAGERGLVRPGPVSTAAGPAAPGPVYRVLEAVCSWKDGNIVRVGASSGTATLVGLGAEWPDRAELLLANLAPDDHLVELAGLPGKVTGISALSPAGSEGADWADQADADTSEPGVAAFGVAGYGVVRVRTA